jgi:hypothetical protein
MPDDETYDLEDEDPEADGVLDASDTLEGDPAVHVQDEADV